jgi:hypothetical protein
MWNAALGREILRISCTQCSYLLDETMHLLREPHVSRVRETSLSVTVCRSPLAVPAQGKGVKVDDKDTKGSTALMKAAR